jgi:hypothetical protein
MSIFDCLVPHKNSFRTVKWIEHIRPTKFCILIVIIFVFCCSCNDYDKAENIKVPNTDRPSGDSLDNKAEKVSKWEPPTGIPYGDPVHWDSPTEYYEDKEKYKKARENIDRRLLELGRRSPRNSDEVKVMMKRCRDHVEDLNYSWSPFGTWTGGVLVCGLLLPPPYVLSCVAVEGEPYTYYFLVVNGVILSSPLSHHHDDCGWPYERITSATMKLSITCHKKVFALQRQISSLTKDKSLIANEEEFKNMAKEWAQQFRNIACDDPGTSVKVEEFRFTSNDSLAYYVINVDSPGVDNDSSQIFTARNPFKHEKREPKTPAEIEANYLESCRYWLNVSKECLEKNRLLVAGDPIPRCLHQFEIEKINITLKSHFLDLKEKYRYINGLSIESPECLIRNGLKLDDDN